MGEAKRRGTREQRKAEAERVALAFRLARRGSGKSRCHLAWSLSAGYPQLTVTWSIFDDEIPNITKRRND